MKMAMLEEAPQDHRTAKKHVRINPFGFLIYYWAHLGPKQALVRDGFQCVVTKVYDTHAVVANKELQEIVKTTGALARHTYCAHIFPESTNANITSSSDKVRPFPSIRRL